MMQRPYSPYIPEDVSDIMDLLGWMMLKSPKFEDKSGYFVGQNIDTTFFALLEGLKNIEPKVGKENYDSLVVMSGRMREHFAADPDDKTDDGLAGRQIIFDMENLIKASVQRRPPAASS
ncbi:hypothetical protein [Sphingobium boeckii]|uniref:Uncharacterized protein n=1 Tax=Sphingobium boeckii TaxID=1082345 RepID=A0A7W9ALA9_9SPHN|nr:hypothetical protein [Sphingobium boeckii]MBB5687775.1 hypothetical protein [Sphingobium boeckii]